MARVQELGGKRVLLSMLNISDFKLKNKLTHLKHILISKPPFLLCLMMIVCSVSYYIVIIVVYLPYGLRKKLRRVRLEKTVYRGVVTVAFSYPRD